MCKLVPITFPTGATTNVADIKVEKLKKYLSLFPMLNGFDRVYLFGSTLEQRCKEDSDIDFLVVYDDYDAFRHTMNWTLPDTFPDYACDDFLRIDKSDVDKWHTGAMREALDKGVLIYERH